MKPPSTLRLAWLFALLLAACGGGNEPTMDASPDGTGGNDASADRITPSDADSGNATDARLDAPPPDTGTTPDARPDTSPPPDAPADVATDAPADAGHVCGNGVREYPEQCDDGNDVNGDGCDLGCTWSCMDNTMCDDGDPCDGTESCDTGQHRCSTGTALADGAACGTGRICRGGTCMGAQCGDGFVTAPEQCDDGNGTDGDGCDNDCTYSCTEDTDCADANPCNGAETCALATHTCAPGAAAADGTACGAGTLCVAGACVTARCGDGFVTAPEQCDDGNGTDGDGCDNDCTYSCTVGADCADTNACNGTETCTLATHTCAAGPPAADGTPCGTGMVCRAGACATTRCGNGVVEGTEQCDDGNGTNGDGCNNDCTYSCTADAACSDGNACNGAETCALATHTCAPGTAPPAGTACDTDNNPATRDICLANTCRASRCGDGYVDAGNGETCEAPTPNCSPTTCTLMTVAVCGNGTLDPGEQCDDGNTARWDGCDGACKLEQTMRANMIALVRPPTGCDLTGDGTVDNRLGQALTQTALDQLNPTLQMGVTNGDTIILTTFLDLDDPLGRDDPAIRLGVFSGTDAVAPFDGTAGEAFTITMAQLTSSLEPVSVLPGSIAASVGRAGPGDVTLSLNLGGTLTPLSLHRTLLSGTTTSSMPPPHIDGINNGLICGAITAGDLDRIPAPTALPAACLSSSGTSSMLDVIALGCTVFFVPVINAAQPDIDLGGDGIYGGTNRRALSDTNGDKIIDTCRDSSTGVTITGDNCAQDPRFDDAYSSALTFSAIRVVITGVR